LKQDSNNYCTDIIFLPNFKAQSLYITLRLKFKAILYNQLFFFFRPTPGEKGFFVSIVRDITLERIRDALLADVHVGGLSDAWTQFCFSRDCPKRV